MIFQIIFYCIFLVPVLFGNQLSKEEQDAILKRLSCERYFVYQDILVNGQTIWNGLGPNCPKRYDCIKKILDQYKRPIKVLDLGASNGYFSFKIAQDYNALCVMVDTSDRLLDLCNLNDSLNGIVYLKHSIDLKSLSLLHEHEHFDIILAFNILHHLHPCKEILDLLFKMGDVVIIETPPANDPRIFQKETIPFIEQYLTEKMNNSLDAQIIGNSLRPIPQQFDYITQMSTDLNLLKDIQYCQNGYSTIFCFGKINSTSFSNLFFNKDIYNALGGLFYKYNF